MKYPQVATNWSILLTCLSLMACSEDPAPQKSPDMGDKSCQGATCADASADMPAKDMDVTDQAPDPLAGMAIVEAGIFQMGTDPQYDPSAFMFGHAPVHEVSLSKYAIDIYEVTVAQYEECMEKGACASPSSHYMEDPRCNSRAPNREDHPINCVDWFQAKAYCEWAGKKLPTEAQWEMAARGPDSFLYPWCNEPKPSCEFAIISEANTAVSGCGTGSTWPVGSRPEGASVYGVMDMIGNVAEWPSDFFDKTYYIDSPYQDPTGPAEGNTHIPRGSAIDRGAYFYSPMSSERLSPALAPDAHAHTVGFRCAKAL